MVNYLTLKKIEGIENSKHYRFDRFKHLFISIHFSTKWSQYDCFGTQIFWWVETDFFGRHRV